MDLRKIPVFAAITQRMGWLVQRQKVLAQNIANTDTPNYQPRDLKEVSFADMVGAGRRLKMTATSGSHINPRGGMNGRVGDFRAIEVEDTYGLTPTKNGVVVEEQMLKVAEARIDYEVMTTLYKKHIGMIRTALGK